MVADHARMLVDLRAWHTGEYEAALAEIRRLVAAPSVSGVRAELAVHVPTPPWEPGPGRAQAHRAGREGRRRTRRARVAHRHRRLRRREFAGEAAAVLDGLGPIGGADHSPGEWLDLDSVVPRVALLAGLIDMVCVADGP